jgi:hypothetical protein
VYITFPKAFWVGPGAEGINVHNFYEWLAPTYASDVNPQRYPEEAVDLATMAPEVAHPTLLFYIFDDQSRALTEICGCLHDSEKETYLCNYFQPYYSRLPGYDETNADCQPSGAIATDFLHDELSGNGGYTNVQIGLEEGDKDIKVMRQGLPERGLWLAGEHTAPFVALGTTTGAYWSGEAVARRIAELHGLEDGAMEGSFVTLLGKE